MSNVNYALSQDANGATILNSKNGQALNLSINDTSIQTLTADTTTFACNAVIDASHTLTLQGTSGTQLTTTDNNLIFEMGRGKLGYTGMNEYFGVSHRDCLNSNDFALLQGELGNTILNAKSGQTISLRVSNLSLIHI